VRGLFTRDDALAGLVTTIVQQILEAHVTDQLRAQPYERTEDRRGYRNGYKPWSLTPRMGTLELRVPQVRQGEFSTDLFLRFQRSEQAFLLALMEMVLHLQGVSIGSKCTDEKGIDGYLHRGEPRHQKHLQGSESKASADQHGRERGSYRQQEG
jgi:hypothetical protein